MKILAIRSRPCCEPLTIRMLSGSYAAPTTFVRRCATHARLGNAVGNAVLQRQGADVAHHLARAVGDCLGWEEFGRGQAAAERNDVGLLRYLEHLADRRNAHTSGSRREAGGAWKNSHAWLFPGLNLKSTSHRRPTDGWAGCGARRRRGHEGRLADEGKHGGTQAYQAHQACDQPADDGQNLGRAQKHQADNQRGQGEGVECGRTSS